MNSVTMTVLQGIAASRAWVQGRTHSERGAAAVEYALLVALIAAVIIVAVATLGQTVLHVFNHTNSQIVTNGGLGSAGS